MCTCTHTHKEFLLFPFLACHMNAASMTICCQLVVDYNASNMEIWYTMFPFKVFSTKGMTNKIAANTFGFGHDNGFRNRFQCYLIKSK